MTKLTFKLSVEESGQAVSSFELGAEQLARLASSLPDCSENKEIFHHLAQSPSSEVRCEVAYKENLDENTVEQLASDISIEVRRRICAQSNFSEWASTELILEIINADTECAKLIAGRISDYHNADVNVIATAVMQHSDPDVRNALAGSWGAPKMLLKKLLSDDDAGVRASAKRTLD